MCTRGKKPRFDWLLLEIACTLFSRYNQLKNPQMVGADIETQNVDSSYL